ncbi:MAG: hypothetical protein JWP87_1321 [Labilithrix sp.]|nr:hypothetical protein [Labilithrix sp.]
MTEFGNNVALRFEQDVFVLGSLAPESSKTFVVPSSFPGVIQVTSSSNGDAPEYDSRSVVRTHALGDVVVDLSESLPLITNATVEAAGGRFVARWSAAASLAETDGGSVVLVLDDGTPFGVGHKSGRWTITVPPGATSVTTPRLPATAFDGTGLPTQVHRVAFGDSDAVDGYDAFRRAPTTWSAIGPWERRLPAKSGLRFRFVAHGFL